GLAARQALRAPAAPQGLDEQNARSQAAAAHASGRALVAEERGLRRDDVEIAHYASLVLVGGELHRLARRLHHFILQARLLLEDAQSRKVVLHLLERREHRLPVGRHVLVIHADRLVLLRLPQAGAEHPLEARSTERPAW